ncbi:FMN-dependent NADH-azoreductase [Salipaludibacillus daqingensis]|uniref:FMN-dependent NADH-azoreductase n=1 Tax=Salipaludibacillus daqingensis TaxID=3041001 RepID=UPI002476C5AC|nr:NAD(P)H-dependent oxidoreductase [Salipaludibacillus daqingensis]
MTLLFVTANPKETKQSYGLQLAETFLKAYKEQNPNDSIEYLDLFKENIPPLEREALAMWEQQGQAKPSDMEEVTNPYVEQFLRAERIVIVTPLWNMSFPPQVKAYVDQLIIPDKTFRFSETGIEGLMQHKRMVHIQSRGGVYSEGPLQKFEHGDSYLRLIFGLIGLKEYDHLFIEGTSTFPDDVLHRLEEAKDRARKLAKEFATD